MDLARVGHDLLVHLVAGGTDRRANDDAAESDHRDLRRAATDVDHHAAVRLHDRESGTDRRRHRLFDKICGAGAGVEGGIVDGTLLHLSDTAWYADDDAGARDAKAEAIVDGADEV